MLSHRPIGPALGCCCIAPTAPGAVGVTQMQPNTNPMEHDGAARRWLLRRWECVPCLKDGKKTPRNGPRRSARRLQLPFPARDVSASTRRRNARSVALFLPLPSNGRSMFPGESIRVDFPFAPIYRFGGSFSVFPVRGSDVARGASRDTSYVT